jgi:ABC-type transporter Mla subunit MlaD
MDDQELKQTMEFIVNQLAEFAARTAQLEDIVTRLANASLRRFDDTDDKINALVDSQMRLTESQSRTDEQLKQTQESLRNLIVVVDRYFSGQNQSRNSSS